MDSKIVCRDNIDNVKRIREFDMTTLVDDCDGDNIDELPPYVSLSPALVNAMIIYRCRLFCAMENCAIEMFSFTDDFIEYEDSFYDHAMGVACLASSQVIHSLSVMYLSIFTPISPHLPPLFSYRNRFA